MSPILVWGIVLAVAVVFEIATVALVSIWFAFGSLLALIAACLKASLSVQIIIFVLGSLLTLVLTRPLASKMLHGQITKTNVDRLIGKKGVVTKSLTAYEMGEVKLLNGTWRALSKTKDEITKGSQVKVLAIEGNHLIVEEI
ncbi:Membrane protein implicated in regulation of membrane protease activity [Kandleria vitulina]|jgi:membrane protein implicated in regulation of membrane protease activity|uniref:NfeD family protein n=1 Tax=Kandleria vitulina TaxID=1630 RepID=UPI0008C3B4E1|nr:NfeD family protein [Kandleria vitulina]SEI60868.1 Membrane protein implicated in regulation of membrane protease activity [Kandleria vitulina]